MITNQETIEILNSWKDAVLDSKTKEAFEKAIKAVEIYEIYEKYDWIFSGICDSEWNNKFDAIDEALGIRLFYWQKYYIVHGCMRQTGFTTAVILRELLDVKNVPWDISYIPMSPKERWQREKIKQIKTKLDNAGIPTRTVFFCKEDKKQYDGQFRQGI